MNEEEMQIDLIIVWALSSYPKHIACFHPSPSSKLSWIPFNPKQSVLVKRRELGQLLNSVLEQK